MTNYESLRYTKLTAHKVPMSLQFTLTVNPGKLSPQRPPWNF